MAPFRVKSRNLSRVRDDNRKPAVFHFVFFDGAFTHADVDILPECFVVVETDPARCYFISGDVAHQRQVAVGEARREFGLERGGSFACGFELPAD